MAYKRNVEIFEEAYEKKDAKSVVSYVARDGRRRYIAGNKNPDGGGTPMPSGGGMVEVTWQELKDKRDNGELNPGSLYRITDYQCTTTQENTRSAGHQFDIVLLALSENKLAEEGWAMMHENIIYDVRFSDGRKKCYIAKDTYYSEEDEGEVRNIVDLETGLGVRAYVDYLEIDEENKEAYYPFDIVCLSVEDLEYNYFQNSNLSAWKVWYCLDNDKIRFGWADDSVDEDSPASISFIFDGAVFDCFRHTDGDGGENHPFGWITEDEAVVFTDTQIPNIGDNVYDGPVSRGQVIGTVSNYTPAHEGTGLPNGRGVIYRLIDEWNNDVGYDFKNIQFIRPMTDGEYDPNNGEDTWVYTFSLNNGGTIVDASSGGVDNTYYYCNKITRAFDLYSNVFFNGASDSFISSSCEELSIIANGYFVKCYNCYTTVIEVTDEEGGAIYINNKRVLTEE